MVVLLFSILKWHLPIKILAEEKRNLISAPSLAPEEKYSTNLHLSCKLQHILVPLILFVVITSASKMFLQIRTKNNKYIPEIGFRAIFSKLKLKTWRRFYFLSSFDPEGGRKQFPSTCVGLKGCWAEQFSVLIGQKLRAAAPFWTAFTESRPEESWDPSSVLH